MYILWQLFKYINYIINMGLCFTQKQKKKICYITACWLCLSLAEDLHQGCQSGRVKLSQRTHVKTRVLLIFGNHQPPPQKKKVRGHQRPYG